jgi:transposase
VVPKLTAKWRRDNLPTAYGSKANLRARKIKAVIPEKSDQIANRKRKDRRGGRPPGFDPLAYAKRNQVERRLCRRKHWRGIATRVDKLGTQLPSHPGPTTLPTPPAAHPRC